MKLLIVYDPILGGTQGGGEKALGYLLKALDFVEEKAFFSPFMVRSRGTQKFVKFLQKEKWKIHTHFVSPFRPFIKFRQLFLARYYKNFKTSDYDVVFTYGAFLSHLVEKPQKGMKVSYLNTPGRVWFGLPYSEGFLRGKMPIWLKDYINCKIRELDVEALHKSDKILAISKNVQMRIYSFYNLKSEVVYPPVTLDDLNTLDKKVFSRTLKQLLGDVSSYFVHVSRLEKYKNIDMLIDLYARFKPRFATFIIGDGAFRKYFLDRAKNILGKGKVVRFEILGTTYKFIKFGNLIFTGYLSSELKNSFVSFAVASLVFNDEDLGLNKVESLLLETPFIGCNFISNTELLSESYKKLLIVEPCNIESFYNRMLIFLQNRKVVLDKKFVAHLSKEFSFTRFKDKIMALIDGKNTGH